MASAKRLVELGMVPALAKEVAGQLNVGTASTNGRKRLTELGMVPRVAREFLAQMQGVKSVRRFTELGVAPPLAAELVKQLVETAVLALLPNWKTALARVRNNTGSATISVWGDSTSAGQFAAAGPQGTPGAGNANGRANSWPSRLAARMRNRGIPVENKGILGMGPGANMAEAITYDPRVSFTGSSSNISQGFTFGGQLWRITSANTLTFTTDVADRLILRYIVNTGSGTFTYSVDGGAPISVNSDGLTNIANIVINGLTRVSHTVTFTWVSGIYFIIGVDAIDTTVNAVRLWNGGAAGASLTAHWLNTSFGWSPQPIGKSYASDLTIIALCINDYLTGVDPNEYQAGLNTLVTSAKQTGDVLLMAPNETAAGASIATQNAFKDRMKLVAASQNVPYLDFATILGPYATAVARGLMYENIHPDAPGHDIEGIWVADLLIP